MNLRNFPTLIEAAAITVCLLLVAGQHSEVGILMSEPTTKTFSEGLTAGR